jgi:hypothetical protein
MSNIEKSKLSEYWGTSKWFISGMASGFIIHLN